MKNGVDEDVVNAFMRVTNRLGEVSGELAELYRNRLSFARAAGLRNGYDLHENLHKAMQDLDRMRLWIRRCWEIVVEQWDGPTEG